MPGIFSLCTGPLFTWPSTWAAAPGAEALLLNIRLQATAEVAEATSAVHHGGFGSPVASPGSDIELSGGMPALASEFVEANGVAPLRVIVRGPPLSFHDELAAATAEAYTLPLLTPSTLMTQWLTKCPVELQEKAGGVAEEGEDAAAKFAELADELKTELLKTVLADKLVKRVGPGSYPIFRNFHRYARFKRRNWAILGYFGPKIIVFDGC